MESNKRKVSKFKYNSFRFLEGMLKYAKQKSNNKYNNEIVVLQQDLLQNTLPSNHFDFVTCAFGLKTFNEE